MRGDPHPLDVNDPRVLVEWTDKLGQVVRPGDYVASRGYSAICIGKVIIISALRKDGKPFTNADPHVTIHLCNLKTMELSYWNNHEGLDVPNLHTERYPRHDVIRIHWQPLSERQ